MPVPYYTTYSAKPLPEAFTANHIDQLLERMAYTDLPGFVVRSAGQEPAQAFMHVQKSLEGTNFASDLTVYRGHLAQPIPGAPKDSTVRMPEQDRPGQGKPTLESVYVSTGALMLELFRPGPEMEAMRTQGIPPYLPDKEYYALSRRLINPVWLQGSGILSTVMLAHDLGVYRRDGYVAATRKLTLPSSSQRTVPLATIKAGQAA